MERANSGTRLPGDAGQVTGFALVWVIVALIMVLVLAAVGGVATDRAAARTAADAAALAGVQGGRPAAVAAASANDATLEEFSSFAGGVEVTVRFGRAVASSRAEAEWVRARGSSGFVSGS